jgi:hypothetical protein
MMPPVNAAGVQGSFGRRSSRRPGNSDVLVILRSDIASDRTSGDVSRSGLEQTILRPW